MILERWLAVFLLLLAIKASRGAGEVIFDMETIRHQPAEVTPQDQTKVPIGAVELVDGKIGKAVRFSFSGGLGPGFMTASVAGTPEWDHAAGFSFYVKGDGSTNWGGLELIDRSDFGLRYGYCFPIDSTQWCRIVVPWHDLIPELAGPLLEPQHGYAPSGLGNFWFGKWFYWRDYPAHSFAIDQVMLEQEILPVASPGFGTGLKRAQAKLKAGQPITLVTMGDSLSDQRHWANQQVLWSKVLAQMLQEHYRIRVTLVNPAIGGTTLSQNLILMPRWLKNTPQPDLVTVWFGGNDWDSGVRGARFREFLALGVDRIRHMTDGKADVLLLTPCPGFKRWDTLQELEQAVREVARDKETGLVDIAAGFRQAGSADAALKQGLWAWDNVHLGTNGHKVTARAVLKALQAEP